MSENIDISILIYVTGSIFGWVAFFFGIFSVSSNVWLKTGDNLMFSGLWLQCNGTDCMNTNTSCINLICEHSNYIADLQSVNWIEATRAFMILCLIFNFIACSLNIRSHCNQCIQTRMYSAYNFTIAGLFGIIGAAVYTARAEQGMENGSVYNYGYSFIFAWLCISLNVFAGLLIHDTNAKLERKHEEN